MDYYFYESQSGVDPEGLHALRLRRDVSDNEAETSKSAITIPTSTPTTSRASVGKTTDQVPTTIREEDVSDVKSRKEDEIMSNPRGWQPPDNATAILKEIDLPDAKINATLKSHLDHLDEEGLKLEDVRISWSKKTTLAFESAVCYRRITTNTTILRLRHSIALGSIWMYGTAQHILALFSNIPCCRNHTGTVNVQTRFSDCWQLV